MPFVRAATFEIVKTGLQPVQKTKPLDRRHAALHPRFHLAHDLARLAHGLLARA